MFVPDFDMQRALVLWQRRQDWPGGAFELLPAVKTGSQHSDNHLHISAAGMSLERSPVSKVRVGGGAEQDISQQQPGRGLSRDQGFSSSRFCSQILHYKVLSAICLLVLQSPVY